MQVLQKSELIHLRGGASRAAWGSPEQDPTPTAKENFPSQLGSVGTTPTDSTDLGDTESSAG